MNLLRIKFVSIDHKKRDKMNAGKNFSISWVCSGGKKSKEGAMLTMAGRYSKNEKPKGVSKRTKWQPPHEGVVNLVIKINCDGAYRRQGSGSFDLVVCLQFNYPKNT